MTGSAAASREEGPMDGASRETGAGGTGAARRVWEWVKVAATAFLFFVVLRGFVVEAFRIPTSSMEDTLLVGDFLLVSKVAYGARVPGTDWRLPGLGRPEVGDVVVFRPPASADRGGGARYVKRVVAGPGDTVAMRSGRLHRNGRPVEEPYARRGLGDGLHSPRFRWQEAYLLPGARPAGDYRPTSDDWGPLRVPRDSVFVLGDNRATSEDSRYWGFVPRGAVTGEPLFVYWSRRPDGPGARPWLERVRWRRMFSAVR